MKTTLIQFNVEKFPMENEKDIKKLQEIKNQSEENFMAAKVNMGINENVIKYAEKKMKSLGFKEE